MSDQRCFGRGCAGAAPSIGSQRHPRAAALRTFPSLAARGLILAQALGGSEAGQSGSQQNRSPDPLGAGKESRAAEFWWVPSNEMELADRWLKKLARIAPEFVVLEFRVCLSSLLVPGTPGAMPGKVLVGTRSAAQCWNARVSDVDRLSL